MHSHGPGGGLPPPPSRPTATHTHIINPAVGCHYFPPGLQLPPQPSGITALRPVPSYTAWWQRHIGVRNLPKVFTPWCLADTRTCDLSIANLTPYCNTMTPPTTSTVKSQHILLFMLLFTGRQTWIIHSLSLHQRSEEDPLGDCALPGLRRLPMTKAMPLWHWLQWRRQMQPSHF